MKQKGILVQSVVEGVFTDGQVRLHGLQLEVQAIPAGNPPLVDLWSAGLGSGSLQADKAGYISITPTTLHSGH